MPPLANQIRPTTLADFIGQKHLVGPNKPIKTAIDKKHLFSFILWGPPGVGKTTLARIYAKEFEADYIEFSAVSAGKGDIRKFINQKDSSKQLTAKQQELESKQQTKPKVLFLDEIHRFNKAQQDFLLPYVENGTITFIGSTTENPSFSVISALLSRLRVFVLNSLTEEEMLAIFRRTKLKIPRKAQEWLINMANGDARQALNILESANKLYGKITLDTLKEALQNKFLRYDKKGDEHYNTISAFIKSMRASDANAAIYYLSRMIEAGEDPLFIARRMVIFASEDIGMAQPTALVVANEVFKACQIIGYPECSINLAHGVAYLAKAKKNRGAYDALRAAQQDIKNYGNLPIPLHLRNAPTKLMKKQGYGKGYQMYPDKNKNLLPAKLKNRKYF